MQNGADAGQADGSRGASRRGRRQGDGVNKKVTEASKALERIKCIIEEKDGPTTPSMMLGCSCCKPSKRPQGGELTRVLLGGFPTAAYSDTVTWEPVHWGQLKLLLSEIEFLTPYKKEKNHNVIYAGASPGIHMPILAKMFPDITFTLIDPQPSMIENGEYHNIFVIQDYMTDGLAKAFALYKDNVLFISDVRIGADSTRETPKKMQERIHKDMINQLYWLRIMNPVSSILKFRLPWTGIQTRYLKGTVNFPVFGKIMTHEARLVVDRGAEVISYDNKLYEGQMAHFNQVLRPAVYTYGGQTGCFDCTSFRKIVYDYLLATNPSNTGNFDLVDQKCNKILTDLNEFKHKWDETRKKSDRTAPGESRARRGSRGHS